MTVFLLSGFIFIRTDSAERRLHESPSGTPAFWFSRLFYNAFGRLTIQKQKAGKKKNRRRLNPRGFCCKLVVNPLNGTGEEYPHGQNPKTKSYDWR
jgi:hypothetical protein